METLPSEVYSQIVQLLRPNGKRTPRHIVPPEIVLSHVSTSWRRLAFSDSKSWELVEVYSPRTLPRAQAYLARSANAAIRLRVELYDYEYRGLAKGEAPSAEQQAFLEALSALLRSAAPRCKAILIFTYHERTAQKLASSLQNLEAPLLQSIRVEINELPEVPDEGPPGDEVARTAAVTPNRIFSPGGVESLRFVSIETHTLPPLRNVTTLELHSVFPEWLSFDVFKQLAIESASLENLSLASRTVGFIREWPTHYDAPGVTFPKLKSLKMSEDYPAFTVKVMLAIAAPKLESLLLRTTSTTFHEYLNSPQVAATSVNPKPTKFPKLEYLTLEFFDMTQTIAFAHAFPTITHLHISYFRIFFTRRFGDDIATTPVWPRLNTIVFEIEKPTHEAKLRDACVQIVTMRKDRGLPVPSLVGDRDVLDVLGKSDFLNETTKLEVLSVETYREPWYVLKHENAYVEERIGML